MANILDKNVLAVGKYVTNLEKNTTVIGRHLKKQENTKKSEGKGNT